MIEEKGRGVVVGEVKWGIDGFEVVNIGDWNGVGEVDGKRD